MVVNTCNLSSWEVDAVESEVGRQLELHSQTFFKDKSILYVYIHAFTYTHTLVVIKKTQYPIRKKSTMSSL